MSDSESEPNPNVFTFQNTTVSARGPHTNITNFNFRSRYMPRNFEKQRYAESLSDQRSLYFRRETSPMSIHSACDVRTRNFQQYYNRMGSQQSVFNGRSGSPVSIRSIDSNASVSAADIAFALSNVKFNKYDMKVIKEAYQKAIKKRVRKRIEKRRNMRLFLKGNRHRSGDDSGEQGSDSSVSSDDCRSRQTSYKENASCSGSVRVDLSNIRRTVKESNIVNDCTDNFRQNNFKNMFSVPSTNLTKNHTFNNSLLSKQIHSTTIQKDRFKNGFLLPSQRFNIATSVIPENTEKHGIESNYRQNTSMNCIANRPLANKHCESGSEEEIFSEMSARDKVIHNINNSRKRHLDSEGEPSLPDKKKLKTSPVKNLQINKKMPSKINNVSNVNNINENSDYFEFAKPSLPVRKSKPKVQEKVIAKSKQPLTGFVEHVPVKLVDNIEIQNPIAVEPVISNENKSNDNQIQNDQTDIMQNSDVSMRPSFIKRKLFTQKLDVGEKANLSNDASNSPQSNVYSALQKEKNKARKLVTSQSCLNRDVQEDNNLLDLIHKIVPPDRINVTNQTTTNQSKIDVNNSNKKDEDDDKWDVTSVISMCNENDVSDTFTDEEIFDNDKTNKTTKNNKKDKPNTIQINTNVTKITEKKQNVPKECKIIVEKMQFPQKLIVNQNKNTTNANVSKSIIKNSAKTFWDTDIDSDAECLITTPKNYIKENQSRGNVAADNLIPEVNHPAAVVKNSGLKNNCQHPDTSVLKNNVQVPETSRWLNSTKNNTVLNSTLGTTRKLNITTLGVKSHRTTKKKKCGNDTCFQETISTKPVTISKTSKPAVNSINPTAKVSQATVISKKSNETKSEKKSKPKCQDAKKPRSNPRTSKSPKDTKSKPNKKVKQTLDISRNQSLNNRPIRSCRTPSQNRSTDNSRLSSQFDITPLKVASKKQKCFDTSFNDVTPKPDINMKSTKSKISRVITESSKKSNKNKYTKKTEVQEKTSSRNPTSKQKTQNCNQSISSSQTHKNRQITKSKTSKQVFANIYQSPRCSRPVRSCRTPIQKR